MGKQKGGCITKTSETGLYSFTPGILGDGKLVARYRQTLFGEHEKDIRGLCKSCFGEKQEFRMQVTKYKQDESG
jgi:hypothetical protein